MATPSKKIIFQPFRYHGNIVLLVVFCLLLQIPLVLVLCMKNGEFVKGNKFYRLEYSGSYGWLYFWAIIFFPIVILLLALKGVELVEISLNEEENYIDILK